MLADCMHSLCKARRQMRRQPTTTFASEITSSLPSHAVSALAVKKLLLWLFGVSKLQFFVYVMRLLPLSITIYRRIRLVNLINRTVFRYATLQGEYNY